MNIIVLHTTISDTVFAFLCDSALAGRIKKPAVANKKQKRSTKSLSTKAATGDEPSPADDYGSYSEGIKTPFPACLSDF